MNYHVVYKCIKGDYNGLRYMVSYRSEDAFILMDHSQIFEQRVKVLEKGLEFNSAMNLVADLDLDFLLYVAYEDAMIGDIFILSSFQSRVSKISSILGKEAEEIFADLIKKAFEDKKVSE